MPRSSGTQKQNPIGKLLRRNRRHPKHRGGPVGTEAIALANIEKNGKNFNYPPEGFVTKIEHSLIYNMINEPKVYPGDAVIRHTAEEDFKEYLLVASGSYREAGSSTLSNADKEEDVKISYAQLSAILALSAENFTAPEHSVGKKYHVGENYKEDITIPEKLCKTVLQCVVRYAEDNDLDREVELRRLLEPVERHTIRRTNKSALRQILPFYVGYVATCLTANPLPMLVGAVAMNALSDKTFQESENLHSFAREKNRRADMEKTSLLDETDDM